MRQYGTVRPAFWTGSTGRNLKQLGPEAQLIGLYLLTNPHANMLGLYYLPSGYYLEDLAGDPEALRKGLARASELDFCRYDPESRWIWVVNMCRQQLAPDGKPISSEDNRAKAAKSMFYDLPKNPWLKDFRSAYGVELGLDKAHPGEETEALGKPLPSPSEALGKGWGYQDQESEHQSEHGTAEREDISAEPPEDRRSTPAVPLEPLEYVGPPVMTFPVNGKGAKTWNLRADLVADLSAAYPGVDVESECRKALAWAQTNPTKRKTARGMPKFLNSWMARQQDRGGGNGSGPPAKLEPKGMQGIRDYVTRRMREGGFDGD